MAGDWIKMRDNLWDDPRVAKIVDMTDSSEAAAIGSLYWLWSTADQHTEDGLMLGLTPRAIDRKTGVQGFAKALCSIGWLEERPDGVRIIFSDRDGPLFIRGIYRDRMNAGAWYALRDVVFSRDGHECAYCGTIKGPMECDHIHPIALGGGNDASNLTVACRKCNRSKGAKTLDQWRAK